MNITYEIIQSSLEATATEMFQAVVRTAMSTTISEALDTATSLTTKDGDLACSGMGIPAFIGCFGKAVQAMIKRYSKKSEKEQIRDGDILLLNDYYNGGITHMNDTLLLMPVFIDGELLAWSCCMAHWGDIGGINAGSLAPNTTEQYQEGLVLSGVKIFNAGELNYDVLDILKSNSRLPEFIEGDLFAQVAAVKTGASRVTEIIRKYGKEAYNTALEKYFDYGEQLTLAGLRKIKKGTFTATELLESGLTFKVTITITDTKMIVDLTDNPAQ